MALVGNQLTTSENGWKRFDNLDSNISYVGAGWFNDPTYSPSNGSRRVNVATTPDFSIRFNFMGDKIRIIGVLSSNWSNNLQIGIDGTTESFSQHATVVTGQVLNYEKLNLEDKEHSVVITNKGNGYWGLDAVDIDENGELRPFVPVIPAQVRDILLRVTMLDSSERDYQLSDDEVAGFIKWFNTYTTTAPSSYKLVKKIGSQESGEYLVFNKIISFEVIKY